MLTNIKGNDWVLENLRSKSGLLGRINCFDAATGLLFNVSSTKYNYLLFSEKAVHQCSKNIRHTACIILNSSNSRFFIFFLLYLQRNTVYEMITVF